MMISMCSQRVVPTARLGLGGLRRSLSLSGGAYGEVRGALHQLNESNLTPDTPHQYISSPKSVCVIGAPMEYGQPLHGTESGPDMIRAAGLRQAVTSLGWRYNDVGDVPMDSASLKLSAKTHKTVAHAAEGEGEGEGGVASEGEGESMVSDVSARNSLLVGEGNRLLSERAREAATNGEFVLTIGGDHSIALGSLAGVLSVQPNLGVIWVDAHADINTPETSNSGNMHGMPLGLLMQLVDPATLPGCEWLKGRPPLRPEQVAYVGLRDLDDGERVVLRDMQSKGMFVSTMQDVDKRGIGGVMDMAIESLGPSRPLHLSYDIDALDPAHAPSTGTIVRGGLNFREAHYVAEAVAETGALISMDMVEVNNELGREDPTAGQRTTEMALVLIASALGSKIF